MASSIVISPQSMWHKLHNDFSVNIEIDGRKYPSATHYIYSKMMPDKSMEIFVVNQIDASTVRKKANGVLFGRKVGNDRKLAKITELIMVDALREGYRARFNNRKVFSTKYKLNNLAKIDLALRDKLLGTGIESIIYSPGKYTYLDGDQTVLGVNFNGNGNNLVGDILLQIRTEIIREGQMLQKLLKEPAIDRLFAISIRRDLLLNQLKKGHFPSNYSLESLYTSIKGINSDNFSEQFGMDYPPSQRNSYWELYKRGKNYVINPVQDSTVIDTSEKFVDDEKIQDFNKRFAPFTSKIPIPQIETKTLAPNIGQKAFLNLDVLNEFERGNIDWIEREYDLHLKQKAVLIVYLEYMNINYDTFIISIGKDKILDLYLTRRFKITPDGQTIQIPLKKYLDETHVSLETLRYIGEEALSDLRKLTYFKYTSNALHIIPNIEERVSQTLGNLKNLLKQSTVFMKYVPKVDDPSPEVALLISDEVPVDPMSPRETYGGESVNKYYETNPDGSCSEEPLVGDGKGGDSGFCPGGDGDDDYEDFRDFDEKVEIQNEDEDERLPRNEDSEEEDEVEEEDEDGEVVGDNQNLGGIIEEVKQKPDEEEDDLRYSIPRVLINPISFQNETDYPYEWLAPGYISMFRIDGYFYPSISHYVVARLGTPIQYKGVHPRQWIQKDSKYIYDPTQNGEIYPDLCNSPQAFKSLKELIEQLPERIKETYNNLFERYANKVMTIKMSKYPFRKLLKLTGDTQLIYSDTNSKTAVGGTQILNILTRLRSEIKTQDIDIRKGPEYDNRINKVLYEYIRDRTQEILKAVVIFAKYKLTPREDYVLPDIPFIGFQDFNFVMRNIYKQCGDIDYNQLISPYPDKFKGDFRLILDSLIKTFIPIRININDVNSSASQSAIQLKNENKSSDEMTDTIFVDFNELSTLIWIHITVLADSITNPLGNEYSQSQLANRIKSLRQAIYTEKIGSPSEVAILSILSILASLRLYFPKQTRLLLSDVEFVKDFIFNESIGPLQESEMYSQYSIEGNSLTEVITEMYNKNEQDIKPLKCLAWVIDKLISGMESGGAGGAKLIIRAKFFATTLL